MRRYRLVVIALAGLVSGCSRPVVEPGRTPPVRLPQPAPPTTSGLPTLQSPEIQSVPMESVIQLPSQSQADTYHTVQAGESLTSIAKRYGVSVEGLRKANGLDASGQLQSQQLLFIPKDR